MLSVALKRRILIYFSILVFSSASHLRFHDNFAFFHFARDRQQLNDANQPGSGSAGHPETGLRLLIQSDLTQPVNGRFLEEIVQNFLCFSDTHRRMTDATEKQQILLANHSY